MVRVCPMRILVLLMLFAAWMASTVVLFVLASFQRLSPATTVWAVPPAVGGVGVPAAAGADARGGWGVGARLTPGRG